MNIAMIGTGYVGLVSGACFADFGHNVVCTDKDTDKITALERGEIPFFEPGLETLVHNNLSSGRLQFSTDLETAVKTADAVFVAVGTPGHKSDGHADLSYVYQAADEITDALEGYTVLVTKSTVPVGTGDALEAYVKKRRSGIDCDVISNPEFLREGSAIEDFKYPDRVIVGTSSPRAREVIRAIYRPFFLNETPVMFTGRRTSELIKYAANAFLATKVTFINEIANLAEKAGADIQDVAKGMGLDKRIGSKFLHAGPGYGGSCFPKDTLALLKTAEDFEVPLHLVKTVTDVNIARKKDMAERIIQACGGTVAGKTLAILGVTFKPNTDDMRNAPSLDIVPRLQEAGACLQIYDPAGMETARPLLKDVVWKENAYATLEGAYALIVLTEWNEFRGLELERVKNSLSSATLIDLRNIYTPDEVRKAGLSYYSIGRPPLPQGLSSGMGEP